MDNPLEIVVTDDGSQTILDKRLSTTYHSTNGAVTESKHVFIDAGLKYLASNGATTLRILEVGFGSGLNAFLTYLASRELNMAIEYFGIEAAPLPRHITARLKYAEFLGMSSEKTLFQEFHKKRNISKGHFKLKIIHDKIEDITIPEKNSLVYYDAFSPKDQSEMWETDILSKVVNAMSPDGILVTYCAQGQFKRNLKQLGCDVESLPGPPGKREIVRATFRKPVDS